MPRNRRCHPQMLAFHIFGYFFEKQKSQLGNIGPHGPLAPALALALGSPGGALGALALGPGSGPWPWALALGPEHANAWSEFMCGTFTLLRFYGDVKN